MSVQKISGILNEIHSVIKPEGKLLISSDDSYLVATKSSSSFQIDDVFKSSRYNRKNPTNISIIQNALELF